MLIFIMTGSPVFRSSMAVKSAFVAVCTGDDNKTPEENYQEQGN